jgi:hypothetical protein
LLNVEITAGHSKTCREIKCLAECGNHCGTFKNMHEIKCLAECRKHCETFKNMHDIECLAECRMHCETFKNMHDIECRAECPMHRGTLNIECRMLIPQPTSQTSRNYWEISKKPTWSEWFFRYNYVHNILNVTWYSHLEYIAYSFIILSNIWMSKVNTLLKRHDYHIKFKKKWWTKIIPESYQMKCAANKII